METKDIAEEMVKAKDKIIVRNREMEETLLAEIGELSKSKDEFVEALQRDQMSSIKRTADQGKVNDTEKTEVAPEETTIFVFGGNKSERETVVEGIG